MKTSKLLILGTVLAAGAYLLSSKKEDDNTPLMSNSLPQIDSFNSYDSGDFIDIILDNYIANSVSYIAVFSNVTNKPFKGCYVQIFSSPSFTGFIRLICYESGSGGVKNAIVNVNTREITYFD